MRVVTDLPVNAIRIGERLRPLSESAVNELADSIRRVGQIQPITVSLCDGTYYLVTGHHRLVAAQRLGMETISSTVLPAGTTEDECLEIEIAENLHRTDLSKDERDRHIRLLADLISKKDANLQSTQNAAIESKREDGRGHRPQGIVSKVADKTGLSRDTVRRALNPEEEAAKRAEKEAARQRREAEQVEHDRQRDEHNATLPDAIKRAEAAKEANRQRQRESRQPEMLAPDNRVVELEEAVRVLEARNTELEAENNLYGEMKAEWAKGGFEAVVAGRDEALRVARERTLSENRDKVDWKRQADFWKGQAIKLGWKPDRQKIDTKTGEVRDA